jgi:hypothetical protein
MKSTATSSPLRPGKQGLRILNLEDGKVVTLTKEYDNFPAWSPKGDVIEFTSFRDGDFEIYTVKPDGSGVRQLTHTKGNDAHGIWSADGEWIVFSSGVEGRGDGERLQPAALRRTVRDACGWKRSAAVDRSESRDATVNRVLRFIGNSPCDFVRASLPCCLLPRPSSAPRSHQTPGATAHLNPATTAKLMISQQFGNTSGSYK